MPLDDDEIVSVSDKDTEMARAISAARETMHQFLDAFFHPRPNQKNFLLKVRFEESDKSEHIWMADLDLSTDPPTGVVANEPAIQRLKYLQRVPFSHANVTDWMYLEDEFLVGGYTTRVLQRSRSKKEKSWWKRLPWKRPM
jgi:uncharacterized protein YegJ (DUF2314 family)